MPPTSTRVIRSIAMTTVMPLAAIMLLLAARPAAAQPMVSQIPPDAMIYIGWTSGEGLTESYANSHLKKLLDASNLPALFRDFLPKVMEKLDSSLDPAHASRRQALMDILHLLLNHPTAIYYRGLDLSNPSMPLPKIGLVSDAGKDAPALEQKLKAQLPAPMDRVVRIHRKDSRIRLWIAAPTTQPNTRPATRPTPQSIRFVKTFSAALEQVNSDPTAIVYIDAPRLLQTIAQSLQHAKNPALESTWSRAINILGLNEVRQVIWTGDFDAANWSEQMFIGVSSTTSRPRNSGGLIALLAGRSISNDLLKTIPQSASMVSACGFDAAALFDQLRLDLGQINPAWQARADGALNTLRQQSGVDLRKDLLDVLGVNWAAYMDVNLGGVNPLGVVYINQLRNSKKAETSLNQLAAFFNRWLAGKLDKTPLRVAFKETNLQGMSVHYLATPVLSPAWVISKDRLYVAMYPEIAVAAARQADSIKNSILDNVTFSSLQTHLSPAPDQALTSVQYANLTDFAPHTYMSWLMLSRYAGLGDLFGIQSPLQILPPLETIMKELTPIGRIGWTDRLGYHVRSVQPFPGSGLLMANINPSMLQYQSMIVAMALPSLNRSREMANRVKSASNLRQIGLAVLLYSNDNKGHCPDSLGTLYLKSYLNTSVFFRPDTNQIIPSQPQTPRERMADWINAHSDYVYLAKDRKNNELKPDEVIAYERFNDQSEGANALFGDGHVEWLTLPELKEHLKK